MPRPAWPTFLALALLVLAPGCAYEPGDLDNPVERRLSWFSFLDAADIRAACGPGAPDRYRIVQNANWERQVRIYELGVAGRPRLLRERVLGPANLARVDLRDPLEPWRGEEAHALLPQGEHARLIASLEASGAFRAPPVGLRLPSERHYWIVAACRDGVFHYNAWLHPSPRYEAITFDAVLARLSPTGIPFVPEPAAPPVRFYDRDDAVPRFTIEIGARGLAGL